MEGVNNCAYICIIKVTRTKRPKEAVTEIKAMTNKERKAEAIAKLKELGLNTKDVGIRVPDTSALYFTIKTLKALKLRKQVRDIAYGAEKVSRCEASGDILEGGNTFVFVNYSEDVIAIIATEIRASLANWKSTNELAITGCLINELLEIPKMLVSVWDRSEISYDFCIHGIGGEKSLNKSFDYMSKKMNLSQMATAFAGRLITCIGESYY